MKPAVDRLVNVRWSETGQYICAWMVSPTDETIVVAYVKMMIDYNDLELLDVEVREGYRGSGYGREIIQAISDMLGQPVLHSEPVYTLQGLRSIAPMFAGQHRGKKIQRPISPMHFVADWENMRALNGV